jgi:hypothetical protein
LGTQRALFIFARFLDGMDIDHRGCPNAECENCGPGWASGDTLRPAWADSLLEDTDPPQIPGSLSHFFNAMSQGRHKLKGLALSTVIVPDSTLAQYHARHGAAGRVVANRNILEKASDSLHAQGMSFADFDVAGPDGQPDGRVDFVFILVAPGRGL